MNETKLGDYIRGRLRQIGMSQTTLAERAGISRQGLVKLLNGEVLSPESDTIRAIASALGVSPVHMFRLLLGKSLVDRDLRAAAAMPGDHPCFVGDITIPNGTAMPPGHRFEKIWDIQNGGSVAWTGRRLRCVDPGIAGGIDAATLARVALVPDVAEIAVPDARPGDVARLIVAFTAPSVPCSCVSFWKMVAAAGKECFPKLDGLNVMVVVTAV